MKTQVPIKMGRLPAILGVLTLLASPTGVWAQDKGGTKVSKVSNGPIPIVRVSPRDAASSPIPLPGSDTPKLPAAAASAAAPMAWDNRSALLRASGISTLPDRPPRTFRLSVRQPFVLGAGWLEVVSPKLVYPPEDYLLLDEYDPSRGRNSYLYARLKVERGGRYVVDFNVLRTTTYTIRVAGNQFEFVRDGRLSIVIDADSTGVEAIRLGAKDGGYFVSVEITRIDDGRG